MSHSRFEASVSERVRDLRELLALVKAELLALEDGTLVYIERVQVGVTAEALAEEFGITPQAANNRLHRLEAVGLLERERRLINGGGKGYVYNLAEGRRG